MLHLRPVGKHVALASLLSVCCALYVRGGEPALCVLCALLWEEFCLCPHAGFEEAPLLFWIGPLL